MTATNEMLKKIKDAFQEVYDGKHETLKPNELNGEIIGVWFEASPDDWIDYHRLTLTLLEDGYSSVITREEGKIDIEVYRLMD